MFLSIKSYFLYFINLKNPKKNAKIKIKNKDKKLIIRNRQNLQQLQKNLNNINI